MLTSSKTNKIASKNILYSKILLYNIKAKFRKATFELLLMSLPALLYIILFKYFTLYGLVIAFKDFNYSKGIFGSAWSGFKNFVYFFSSDNAWIVTRNTILYNLAFIVLGTAVAIFSALILYEITSKFAIKVYQTILFLPFFLSWIVVAYMVYAFLNEPFGIFNSLLSSLGLPRVAWYSESVYWPFVFIFMGIWKGIGYSIIINYSVLLSIDPTYFEAASIDGAGKMKAIWHISLPHLIPITIVLTLLAIGRIFYSDFGMFQFLPLKSGMIQPVTDVIDTYIFRSIRFVGDFGMVSAVNLYQSVMGLIVILACNAIVRKVDKESSIF